jgi:hypothetical protein
MHSALGCLPVSSLSPSCVSLQNACLSGTEAHPLQRLSSLWSGFLDAFSMHFQGWLCMVCSWTWHVCTISCGSRALGASHCLLGRRSTPEPLQSSVLGFELRALLLHSTTEITAPTLVLFFQIGSCFYPGLASNHDSPPTSASFIARITDMCHYTCQNSHFYILFFLFRSITDICK